MGKDYIDFINGVGRGRPVVDLTERLPGYNYETFTTLDGKVHDVPTTQKSGGFKMVCELFFCNHESETFGVRYTDGEEKIVQDTPENRRYYQMAVEMYRDKMGELFR
jgi:hypothetical protein